MHLRAACQPSLKNKMMILIKRRRKRLNKAAVKTVLCGTLNATSDLNV